MIEGQYLELYKKDIDDVLSLDNLTMIRIDVYDSYDKNKQYSLSEWLSFLCEGDIKDNSPIPVNKFVINSKDCADQVSDIKNNYLNKTFPFIDIVFHTTRKEDRPALDEDGVIITEEIDGDIIAKLATYDVLEELNYPVDNLDAVKNSKLVEYINNL